MLKFYRDKKQLFECKVKVNGAKLSETTARLVLADGKVNHIFEGNVDVLGNCTINVPTLLEIKNSKGIATLELRIDNVVFEPYKSKYELIDKVNVKNIKVNEAKVIKKKPNMSVINEMIKTFNRIPSKHKKTLKEYVEYEYKPSKKARRFAKPFFNNLAELKAKIIMYEFDNIYLGK